MIQYADYPAVILFIFSRCTGNYLRNKGNTKAIQRQYKGMPQEHTPLISIITVVLNRRDTIQRTISSVVPQLSNNVEYIVIDGGSSDGTLDIIKQQDGYITYWVSEPDRGIYDAWNKGIAVARGKYIAFVGADDHLEAEFIARCVEFIKENNECDYISLKARINNHKRRVFGKKWRWSAFRRYMTVAHVGSLHNRKLYSRFGHYDTSYRVAGDYEFLLRAGRGLKTGFIDYVGITMGQNGVSNKLVYLALRETLRAKVSTKACGMWVASVDYCIALAKYYLRRLYC